MSLPQVTYISFWRYWFLFEAPYRRQCSVYKHFSSHTHTHVHVHDIHTHPYSKHDYVMLIQVGSLAHTHAYLYKVNMLWCEWDRWIKRLSGYIDITNREFKVYACVCVCVFTSIHNIHLCLLLPGRGYNRTWKAFNLKGTPCLCLEPSHWCDTHLYFHTYFCTYVYM